MCLEDRFLVALYQEANFLPLKGLATSLSITENAAWSIIRRINDSFPHYVLLQLSELDTEKGVAPNKELHPQVQAFLREGGFTAINERELEEYYKTELESYTRFQKIKTRLERLEWMKWTAGALLTIGAAIGVRLVLQKRKSEF